MNNPASDKQQPYDIIGDIHGCAYELETLLGELGYREIDGTFQHPSGRKVIFLGDYIDRGPEIRRVLQIVRAMIDGYQALGILGNHEINALRYHQRGPDGEWLRAHGKGKKHQHKATLAQLVQPHPEEWNDWRQWLAHLPMWLDLPGLRVVHAAWSDSQIAILRGHGPLSGDELVRLSEKESTEAKAISELLNGLELPLPEGEFFETPDLQKRTEFRSRWWNDLRGLSNRQAVFPDDPRMGDSPCIVPAKHAPYPDSAVPVFFGHYAVLNDLAGPLASNVACLDYGAAKGGRIGAYRWDCECELDAAKFFLSPKTEAYHG